MTYLSPATRRDGTIRVVATPGAYTLCALSLDIGSLGRAQGLTFSAGQSTRQNGEAGDSFEVAAGQAKHVDVRVTLIPAR